MASSYIRTYDNFTPHLCDILKTHLDNSDKVENLNTDYRKCLKLELYPNELIFKLLIAEVKKIFLNNYFQDTKNKNLFHCRSIEIPSIIKYRINSEDIFHEHADNWNNESASRQISVIIYLNDVDEGGETVFPDFNITIKPKKGTILFFPANFVYTHKANPAISNDKYVVVTWLCFETQKNLTKFYLTTPF